MSRILVVEDEAAIAELVAINLRHAGYEVTVVGDADSALRSVDRMLPDLVLLDWMLPGQSGLALAKAWRAAARTKPLPIIMLTARAEEGDKLAGLDGGADDYLTKPFSFAILVARLRALVRRGAGPRPAKLVAGDLVLDPPRPRCARADEEIVLTGREFAILELLMRRAGDVISKLEVLEHVWDFAFDGDPNIVEVYVRRLREKIDRPFGRGAIETVRGVGYRLDPNGG